MGNLMYYVFRCSALNIFGGGNVKYDDCVQWNREHEKD